MDSFWRELTILKRNQDSELTIQRKNRYAIDSSDSFDLLPDFLHTLRKAKSPEDNPTPAMTPENTPFPFICIANKCDKAATDRVVSAQQGLAFARSAGGLVSPLRILFVRIVTDHVRAK